MVGSRSFASSIICACIALFASQIKAADQLDLPDLIEKVKSAVVRIDVKGGEGDSLGSGFVVDADGIVVTNHHVIAGANEAKVVFPNNESAKVLGTFTLDKKHDIAVLKIDKKGLPALKLATALPRQGEAVVTYGAPLGLSFSASEGIISAMRPGSEISKMVGEEKLGTWLQITAPISPGNSGGPLFNRSGEIIGANTLGSTALGGGQNLNFAISSLDIAEVLKAAKKQKLMALSDGAAKIKHERAKPQRHEIAVDKIPKEKIEGYIKSAKGNYKEAVTDARKLMAAAKKTLTDMKDGKVGARGVAAQRTVVILVRGKQIYEYPDQKTKSEMVREQQEEVTKCEEHYNKIQDPQTGMLAYLMKSGPTVELKQVGDVGCVPEIFVTTITDSDEFIGHLDDRLPVAMRGLKTDQLASGHSIPGRLVYVCSMEAVGSRGGAAINIRVLRELPEEVLAGHLAELGIATGSSGSQAKKVTKPTETDTATAATTTKPAEPEFRTWSDKSGKHKIEATLAERTTDKVVLKRRDGQLVPVPLAVLSQTDLDYLKTLPTTVAK